MEGVMRDMKKLCCGTDGKPDFEKMIGFMDHHNRSSKLDAIGWALFFIWVGVAWIADVGLGAGSIGVAVIILGMQFLRRLLGLHVEFFWVVVSLGFAIGGLWNLFNLQTPFTPIVFIVAGTALLVSVMWFGRKRSHPHPPKQDKVSAARDV
jgi:hypothetical protein